MVPIYSHTKTLQNEYVILGQAGKFFSKLNQYFDYS